ncbi:girdin-like [Pseudochaenichthys georgianus]|uniref:girdin-like n=1 Tax=Pseudochaenichthys georgianus TaxID=52239 RepID=UPI0039C0D7D3
MGNPWEKCTTPSLEEKATRSKCSVLQGEVRELSEKLSNRSTVTVKFNEMRAKIEEKDMENQNLEKKLKYLKKRDEVSEELRAKYEAGLQILVQLEKDLCKMHDEVKEATEGLTCKKDLLLKDHLHFEEVHERVLVLEETNKMAEFEREEIQLQNDDLESRIQDLQIWIQKEKDFCEIHDSTKEAQKELKRQNRVLMEKLQGLQEEEVEVKVLAENCRITKTTKFSTPSLRRKKPRGPHAAFCNLVLCKAMGELQRKLDREENWWSKCDEIKEETVALKMRNRAITERIQQTSRSLQTLSVLEADHKAMGSENTFLLSQNKDLQRTLDQLEKKLSKEQTQTLKNHLVTEENGAVIQVNSHLEHQIREVRYSLQGESILDINLDSLREEKQELKVQKATLKKDLTELRKTESRERSQQEKRTALRGENGNLRRDQEVLRGNIRDQEVLRGNIRDQEVLRGNIRDQEVLRGNIRDQEVLRGNIRDQEVLRGNIRDQEVLRGNTRDQENLLSCSQAETKSPCLLATFF